MHALLSASTAINQALLDAAFHTAEAHRARRGKPVSSQFIYDRGGLTEVQFVCGTVVILIQLNNKWICCSSLQLWGMRKQRGTIFQAARGAVRGTEGRQLSQGWKLPQDNKAQFINLSQPWVSVNCISPSEPFWPHKWACWKPFYGPSALQPPAPLSSRVLYDFSKWASNSTKTNMNFAYCCYYMAKFGRPKPGIYYDSQ